MYASMRQHCNLSYTYANLSIAVLLLSELVTYHSGTS